MAFQGEIIPFTLRSGTGIQTINHIRYPDMIAKGIIFISEEPPGTNRGSYNFGLDDGTTHIGNSVSIGEIFTVCLTARMYSNQYSLVGVQAQAFFGGASSQLKGYVSAINTGSFDITFDQNDMSGFHWYAIILGGDDVNCKVGIINPQLGLPKTETIGFEAVALLSINTPYIAGNTGFVAGAANNLGFAVPCNNHQVAWGIASGSISSECRNFLTSDICWANVGFSDTIGTAPNTQREVTSYTSNAFVLDGDENTPFTDAGFGYMAIGGMGVSANLAQIIQPTSTGIQNIAITALNPELVLFGSTNCVISGNIAADLKLTFGAYDKVSQVSQWIGQTNGGTFPYPQHGRSTTSAAILMATATGSATSTVNAQATCALAANNIAVNWLTVDSTQRELWALILASDSSALNPCGGFNPVSGAGIYKMVPGRTNDRLFVV